MAQGEVRNAMNRAADPARSDPERGGGDAHDRAIGSSIDEGRDVATSVAYDRDVAGPASREREHTEHVAHSGRPAPSADRRSRQK